ncbi:MAG: T9SS type A sorting domain-containing protein [Bacteroidota bacterium]
MKTILLLLLGGLSSLSLYGQFTGGLGDGYDRGNLNLILTGYDAFGLFAGGLGDGYDRGNLNLILTGYDASGLFAGGNGDGYDRGNLNLILAGYDASGLFAGGNGDGYDLGNLNLILAGYDASGLFAGGNGDGYDRGNLNLILAGYDASGLFAGGFGDGYDMAENNLIFLPLTLLTFEAIPHEKYVLLQWVTTDEVDTDYFLIERSRSGTDFTTLDESVAAAGFSTPGAEQRYSLRDEDPLTGTSYYRLRSVDLDGSFTLSALRQVDYQQTEDWDFALFPNPNDGRRLSIKFAGTAGDDPRTVRLMDAHGRVILQQRVTTGATTQLSLVDGHLPAGTYVVRVTDKSGTGRVKILLVQ